MDKERHGDQSGEKKDGQFDNNEATTLKEEQSHNFIEDKEKDVLEDSDKENYAEQADSLKESDKTSDSEDEVGSLKAEISEAKDKYLRLYSEFENFRRRNAKERLELVKTANEDVVVALLPILDDFERASKAIQEKEEAQVAKEGFQLIHHKFLKILEQKGLKPMKDLKGESFDAEVHEAITQIPAPEEKLKGKIVDVIENGYYLNDKVIRYAKVVIGA